jgi:hypothetical protein
MIHFGVVEDRQGGAARTRFGIRRSVNHASQAPLDDGAGAHGARFNCNIEVAPIQPVVRKLFGGAAQRQDFRVGGGVREAKWTIVPSRYNFTVPDYNGPHRNFPLQFGTMRLTKSAAHEIRVHR